MRYINKKTGDKMKITSIKNYIPQKRNLSFSSVSINTKNAKNNEKTGQAGILIQETIYKINNDKIRDSFIKNRQNYTQ